MKRWWNESGNIYILWDLQCTACEWHLRWVVRLPVNDGCTTTLQNTHHISWGTICPLPLSTTRLVVDLVLSTFVVLKSHQGIFMRIKLYLFKNSSSSTWYLSYAQHKQKWTSPFGTPSSWAHHEHTRVWTLRKFTKRRHLPSSTMTSLKFILPLDCPCAQDSPLLYFIFQSHYISTWLNDVWMQERTRRLSTIGKSRNNR